MLVDTDVLIDYLRDRPDAVEFMETHVDQIAISKMDTVNEALAEYLQRREQQKILSHFGTVDFHEDYDPKRHRR